MSYTASQLRTISDSAPDQTTKFIDDLQPRLKANADVGLTSLVISTISDSGLKSSVQSALTTLGFAVTDDAPTSTTTISWAIMT